ncbi:hypothetical protein CRV03_06880 [Arcobacter sp. F155]|uniref:hypothetical protein n=1 Tax=Arcobacter sp. F155 TaxID=2044512 RepID=UPI00100AC38C|nr:hypothetical protein [Arcobacter sp. F155]RXJ76981.1 hypothetical protein CRV03_06880 [Arcobacter sp. F155]
MLELLSITVNLLVLLVVLKQTFSLTYRLNSFDRQKEEVVKELIKESKNNLYLTSTISSGIETNLEYKKLNEEMLVKSLNNIVKTNSEFEKKIKTFERKLVNK